MSRFNLTNQFFEDEVREGFYIPSVIKKAWGAELQVINDIDHVCSELGIKYFASWGTFLGAVRHGGYVPWDDDFDICMLRDDYLKFVNEGLTMMPKGYVVYNHKTRADHTKFVANVVAKARICFEPDHLKKFHGFPYIASVDLFLIDYMSPDANEHELIRLKSKLVLRISDEIMEGKLNGDELKEKIRLLEEKTGIKVPDGLDDNGIRQFLDITAEELFAYYVDKKDKAEQIVQMMPCGIWDTDFHIMPVYFYRKRAELPFEMGTMPVPLYYEPAIRHHYTNYMELIKGGGVHEYPFFNKMRADLQEVLDFDLPEYRVDAGELIARAKERSGNEILPEENTYKAVVYECLDEMQRLSGMLNEAVVSMQAEQAAAVCGELQQLAIDLGTYMETVKGERYDIVAVLEKYCEALYEQSQLNLKTDPAKSLIEINSLFDEIVSKAKSRREILFLPFKGEYWEAFEEEYGRAVEDPDVDVYVVPIPYFYKDYLGRLYDMQYDPGSYPDDLNIIHFEKYDYALRHPDVIYIQNPYDEWNEVTSVPPFFYSDKLLQYTDKLIYIPWFRTYDFTRENGKEYFNMRYYCTVPGVINADEVILQSETIRETYIEKLCDFAGEETRKLWEWKLTVETAIEHDDKPGDRVKEADEAHVKTLLYYPDFSDILYYGQQAVDKLKSVINLVKDAEDPWKCIILKGRLIDNMLKDIDKDLYTEYTGLLKAAGNEDYFEIINEDEADFDELALRCSAFYGDRGHIAHVFNMAGKPVKIQSYETLQEVLITKDPEQST